MEESSFSNEEETEPIPLTESNKEDERFDAKGKSDLLFTGPSAREFNPSLLIFEKNLESHLEVDDVRGFDEKDWLTSDVPDNREWLSNKEDEPNADDPNAEDPSAEDPNADDPNADDPSAEDPNADDPRADDPNVDDPSADDPNPKEEKFDVKFWSRLDTSDRGGIGG